MKKKSNFDFSLDFKPYAKWPLPLPAVALGSYLLAGFQVSDEHDVHEHKLGSQESNTALFLELYPQLTLSEIARLVSTAAFHQVFQEDLLFKGYHLHSSVDLKNVLKTLALCEDSFQSWVAIKKLGYHELLPLTELSASQLEFVAAEIVASQEGRNDGAQRMEWLSDLILMGQDIDSLKNLNLSDLRKLRYPVTSARDQNLAQATLHWPKAIRSQFTRRGDKGGFDVHFFAGTPLELTKTAQHLIKVAEEWNSNLDKNS